MKSDSPFVVIHKRTADNGFIPVRATTLCVLLGLALSVSRDSSIAGEIIEDLLGLDDKGDE